MELIKTSFVLFYIIVFLVEIFRDILRLLIRIRTDHEIPLGVFVFFTLYIYYILNFGNLLIYIFVYSS